MQYPKYLYTRNQCPGCEQVKAAIRGRGLTMPPERNVDRDPGALEEAQRLGIRAVPALVVFAGNGAPRVVVGAHAIVAELG